MKIATRMAKYSLIRAVSGEALPLKLDQLESKVNNVYKTECCRLFRALLRQCTYLPDSAARHYFHKHIINRFRTYCPRPSHESSPLTLTDKRRHALLKEARKRLAFLARANAGHPPHLLKVLAMTYGRTGRRRRELMKTLITPNSLSPSLRIAMEASQDEKFFERYFDSAAFSKERQISQEQLQVVDESSTVQKSSASDILLSSEGPVLGPQLRALIKSQREQKLSISDRAPIRKADLSVPEKNRWGYPMPLRRVRNMKERSYAEILHRIMPPLPETEWNRLRDLASGQLTWEGPVWRRRMPNQNKQTHKENPMLNYSSALDYENLSVHEEDCLLKTDQFRLIRSNPHTLTPRLMRSLWSKIFVQCPVMQWDVLHNRWRTLWGNTMRNKEVVLSPNRRTNASVFEGVNEQGKVAHSKTSSRPSKSVNQRQTAFTEDQYEEIHSYLIDRMRRDESRDSWIWSLATYACYENLFSIAFIVAAGEPDRDASKTCERCLNRLGRTCMMSNIHYAVFHSSMSRHFFGSGAQIKKRRYSNDDVSTPTLNTWIVLRACSCMSVMMTKMSCAQPPVGELRFEPPKTTEMLRCLVQLWSMQQNPIAYVYYTIIILYFR